MKKIVFCFFLIIFQALIAMPAGAHMLWLNPSNYYPEVGSTVEIGIGWGHQYKADRTDEAIKEGRVATIQALTPDGHTIDLESVALGRYRLPIDKPGAYVVTARIKPGFFTTTPEGRKWGNRKQVPDAVKCTNFHIEAKTVLLAGGSAQHVEARSGQPLELIPVSDPGQLKVGDRFSVRVLHEGSPLAGADVKAVYAGFEKEKSAASGAKSKGHHGSGGYPVETVTDAEGNADIPLDRAGYWMVVLSHRPAYPDPETCDQYMHNVTFAFEVRP